MNESKKVNGKNYIGYDYKEVSTMYEHISMYLDGYASFGWTHDENVSPRGATIQLKRDRKIMNKMELTRLERNFEACMSEIKALENAKTGTATMVSIIIGIIGTAFIAGSVFAVTHEPPLILLTIILAIPGFVGWIVPCFIYKVLVKRSIKKLTPLIEAKYDEIHEVCEKGNKLLNG